jgi:diguanylate cyclase (GGDEF)-like protein
MLSNLTPTEVAFVMAGLMQAVPAVLWVIGGWVLGDSQRDTQRAALQWSIYSGLSAISFVFLVDAMEPHSQIVSDWLRAIGNISGVIGLMALQRGIWIFTGRPVTTRGHLIGLAVVLIASWMGLDAAFGPIRVGVNSAVLAIMAIGMARDLHGYATKTLQLRWPWMLPLPLWISAAVFIFRGLRAVSAPATVVSEMTVNSGLNVASSFIYVVLSLSFHAMLMAMVMIRLVANLQRLSRHDGLTGLLNRRALEEALDAQVQRSCRGGEAFCVLMLDADHFKSINDQFGHAVGDLALKHLSSMLRGHMREVDRVARFGGEEFLVLMPGLRLAEALPVAERLRALISSVPLPHGDATTTLSVSIGIAEWGGPQEEPSRLLVRADAALYQAKQRGRDRVAYAGLDTGPGALPNGSATA